MSERPILFSGPMVRAILEGRKTQTRRVVKPQPDAALGDLPGAAWNAGFVNVSCPYGAPGDHLWVKESYWINSKVRLMHGDSTRCVAYRAEGEMPAWMTMSKWCGGQMMPRWASRLSLLIKSVRVERLQEISEADARAEGMYFQASVEREPRGRGEPWDARDFAALWDSINAKSHPWSSNPWVWVVEFEKINKE